MSQKSTYLILGLLSVAFVSVAYGEDEVGFASKRCVSCHSKRIVGKSVHPPAKNGECDSCHTVDKKKKGPSKAPLGHPAFTKPTETSEVNELCLGCHDAIGDLLKKSSTVHSAVADSSCTACHDPHSSQSSTHLLKSGGVPKLCFSCHDDIETKLKESKYKHSAPVAECTGCHNPHASSHGKLLKEAFSSGPYAKFDEKQYALCFGCHDSGLATQKTVSKNETGFRNGAENLHYIHIQDKKQPRGCRACHDPHASGNPNLIQKEMPYKNYKLPLTYSASKNGGSCATACHGTKKYDRVKAVVNKPGR